MSQLMPARSNTQQLAHNPLRTGVSIRHSHPPHTAAADMSIQTGLGAEVIPLSRLHGAAVVCLVGIGKPEVGMLC